VKNRVFVSLVSAVLVTIIPALLVASDRPHFDSGFRSGDIIIDGHHEDWSGTAAPLGSAPVSIQVVNDNDALYLRLAASDPAMRMQILRQGMIVWFDEKGGTKKRLGIHFPVVDRGSGEEGGRGYGRGGRRRGDPTAPQDDYEPSNRVDILGPGKDDARSLTLDHASGIEVALHMVEGSALYELKVPLTKTAEHPYAINATPGATIGVGFETPKIERPTSGNGGGFGGGRGGMGGGMRGRGRPGGGSGSRGGEREYQPPKPLKAWATVTLSRPPAR